MPYGSLGANSPGTDWNQAGGVFGATAHRKDMADSEGGADKHHIEKVQMAAKEGETIKIIDAHECLWNLPNQCL